MGRASLDSVVYTLRRQRWRSTVLRYQSFSSLSTKVTLPYLTFPPSAIDPGAVAKPL
ncbi:hypothetical protein BTJ68_03948 [Hortaea werneckii EXF-2000]|uniref:Uncharacterized protein n=1 Tax=Hortaea werneckii EXF-2000 TaxID=1157616 RepID=A0A1Z5TIM8_HORWE|nr:hypothetical protein BTJ68_03948 [Hortaea werneckii EXF-2000]